MAFFWNQRPRLLREESWDAPALAQEIYAMMSPDAPMTTNGQVTISPPASETPVAPLVLDAPAGQPAIQFMQNGTPTGTLDTSGNFTPAPTPDNQNPPAPALGVVGGGGRGGGGTIVPVWG